MLCQHGGDLGNGCRSAEEVTSVGLGEGVQTAIGIARRSEDGRRLVLADNGGELCEEVIDGRKPILRAVSGRPCHESGEQRRSVGTRRLREEVTSKPPEAIDVGGGRDRVMSSVLGW